MIEKILVPLDGSEQSEGILPYVSKVATGLGATVVLLSVLDQGSLGVGRSYFSRLYQRAESGAREGLVAAAGLLVGTGVAVEEVVVSGRSADEIVRAADAHDCSLIMMSTHGRNALARGILGSVTDEVIHSANVPVLAMTPERATTYRGEDSTLTSILVALDGSDLAETVLPYVTDLASRLSLEILLVRVVPPIHAFWMDHLPEELSEEQEQAEADARNYLEHTAARLSGSGLSVQWRLLAGHPATAIVELAREMPHDIVALATHGRSGIARLTMGSVSEAVIRGTGDPVLVVRPLGVRPPDKV